MNKKLKDIMNEYTYKNYVKPELIKEFEKMCRKNSLDFYSSGCMTSAHIIMHDLMKHTHVIENKMYGRIEHKKVSPKEAWESGMRNTGHSGASAAMTALTVAKFSLRGDEFKEWCKKENIVMVKWE